MRTIDFSPLFRHSVGFDRMQRIMDAAAQTEQNNAYPPYNIEQLGEDGYQVTLAVAGFAEDDIDLYDDEFFAEVQEPTISFLMLHTKVTRQLRRLDTRLYQVLTNHVPKGVDGITLGTKVQNGAAFGSGRHGMALLDQHFSYLRSLYAQRGEVAILAMELTKIRDLDP